LAPRPSVERRGGELISNGDQLGFRVLQLWERFSRKALIAALSPELLRCALTKASHSKACSSRIENPSPVLQFPCDAYGIPTRIHIKTVLRSLPTILANSSTVNCISDLRLSFIVSLSNMISTSADRLMAGSPEDRLPAKAPKAVVRYHASWPPT